MKIVKIYGILVGLGISMVGNYISTGTSFVVEFSPTLLVTFVFLIVILISSFIIGPTSKFQSHKVFGVFLVGIYLVYLCIAVLVEFKLLLVSN